MFDTLREIEFLSEWDFELNPGKCEIYLRYADVTRLIYLPFFTLWWDWTLDWPDDGEPVKAERLGGGEGAEGDDEGDVEDGGAQHAADVQGVLRTELEKELVLRTRNESWDVVVNWVNIHVTQLCQLGSVIHTSDHFLLFIKTKSFPQDSFKNVLTMTVTSVNFGTKHEIKLQEFF